ncbi:MAG: glutamate synthase subunit beta [Luteitalea sp.]
MGKPTGFLELTRETPTRRPVQERVQDWLEVYQSFPVDRLRGQASRCMDCGIPFCHQGCPLGNLIPDWNDLVYRDRWREAATRLHATNNFPEFTGRLCPAPCEAACVLGINDLPVTIKQVEVSIIDHACEQGWVAPEPAPLRTGRRVAVIGSGPAGLAAAQQLARQGHEVVVFERSDRIGGLLRYGIPDFKMHKRLLDRRLEQMAAEGVEFRTGADVGGAVSGEALRAEFDAICLAVGAAQARPLGLPGSDLSGVHYAMTYLERQNRLVAGDAGPHDAALDARGKRVIILGGGDTGADCLGTAHRQGAASVRQYEIAPRPPENRSAGDPWPQWPTIYRVSAAHEEGGEREYAVMTTGLEAEDGTLKRLHGVRVELVMADGRPSFVPVPGTEFHQDVDLLLLAMGFSGPERLPLFEQLGVTCDAAGRVQADPVTRQTAAPDVFVAGDARRGASLIVWAIAEGRQAAEQIGRQLSDA